MKTHLTKHNQPFKSTCSAHLRILKWYPYYLITIVALSQVIALSQIMMDPYLRTIVGLRDIIEKDFIHFGHRFRSRLGPCAVGVASRSGLHFGYHNTEKSNEVSLVFLQVSTDE
jgi:hypothetical protein